mgnify:CR=1 FL=1
MSTEAPVVDWPRKADAWGCSRPESATAGAAWRRTGPEVSAALVSTHRWMQRHGYDAACDESLRAATTDLQWAKHEGLDGNTRDAHPDSCIAQSLFASATYSIRDSCVAADPAWGYRYDETLPSDGDGDGASSESSAWAQTTTWSYVRASFAWKEFVLGFLVSGTAAVLGLRYWMHRRRQLLEAGVLELREMRLAGAIAKGVQYPAYP